MRRWLVLVLAGTFVALAVLVPGSSSARPSPGLELGHRGRWLTDAEGRVVILHGVNMVAKLPPYDPSTLGFDEDDAAFLQRYGFNTVRLGLIFKAIEPQRGQF